MSSLQTVLVLVVPGVIHVLISAIQATTGDIDCSWWSARVQHLFNEARPTDRMETVTGSTTELLSGTRVRLGGLQAAQDLNGAVGVVVGSVDTSTGRVPVKLLGSAARTRPRGIKPKPTHMTVLPPQRAVTLYGYQAHQVDLTPEQLQELANSSANSSWRRCPLPAMLGVPLAMYRLDPAARRPQNEQPAMLMLVNPITGLAPSADRASGLGKVLLARTDGKDWSVDEMWQLHDYNDHLMDMWPEWFYEGFDEPEVVEARTEALSPEGFAAFTRARAEDDPYFYSADGSEEEL